MARFLSRPTMHATLCALLFMSLCLSQAATAATNIALGKPYTMSLPPNYPLSCDAGDAVQITDGARASTNDTLWVQKASVGWMHYGDKQLAITVDLGTLEPIRGAALSTGAGTAGCAWPRSIAVLVSDNGSDFFLAGDLARSTEAKLPPAYGAYSRYTYRTLGLHAKGRYVRFVVAVANAVFACDEIEVYRGDDSLLNQPGPAKPIGAGELEDKTRLTRLGCYQRMRRDIETIESRLDGSNLSGAAKRAARQELAKQRAELEAVEFPDRADNFRAIVPFNDPHRRILQVHGRVLAASGASALSVWQNDPYEPLGLLDSPRRGRPSLKVTLLRGEYRSTAFNVTNASRREREIAFQIQGIDPAAVRVYQVEPVDTREGEVIASALTPLRAEAGNYRARVPSGMTRQIWLTFHSREIAPGTHRGRVALRSGAFFRHNIPLELRVATPQFPEKPDLAFALFDYAFDKNYGIVASNQQAAYEDMRAHWVDSVWCTAASTPMPAPGDVDAEGNLRGTIRYERWDAFVKSWPNVRHYIAFPALTTKASFAGHAQGTPAFERAVSQWAADWAAHNRRLGLKTGQALILFYDEPNNEDSFKTTYHFGKAFKAGTSEILVFSDPGSAVVDAKYGREAMSVCDIICPNLSNYREAGERVRAYHRELQQQGKTQWFYECSGPTRMFNCGYWRLQPWHCFAAGAVGSCFWSYGDVGGAASSWNEYAALWRISYSPVYLAPDGVTNSKLWEAAREGIEDYQYLVMLRDRVAALEKAGDNSPALREAKQLLAHCAPSVADRVVEQFGKYYMIDRAANPCAVAEEARLAVLRTLESLPDVR